VLDVQVADRGRWRRVTFYAEPADPEVSECELLAVLTRRDDTISEFEKFSRFFSVLCA
jgi:hypothetical protein